jgi:natural product precursor
MRRQSMHESRKKPRRLRLTKETLRNLDDRHLKQVVGGYTWAVDCGSLPNCSAESICSCRSRELQ